MDLSRTRSLETLELIIYALGQQYPLLLHLLSTCSSPLLQSIDILMWIPNANLDPLPLLEAVDWSQLDALAGNERFPALRSFRLDVFPTCTSVPRTFFRRRLPEVEKRGVLVSPRLDRMGKEDEKGNGRAL